MALYLLVAASSLVVGFLAGIAFDDALDLYRSSRKERPVSPTRNHAINRWLLTFVLVVNAGLAAFLIYQRADSANFTRCTSDWQSDFATVYKARSDAAADSQSALDDILAAVATESRDDFRASLNKYQQLRRDQIAERKANPLPELPEQVCGQETK